MRTIKYTFLLLVLLSSTSCEDLLDKEPLGTPDVANYYDTQATYLEALSAVYDQFSAFNNEHRPSIVGDVLSDDLQLGPTRNNVIVAHYNYAFDASRSNTPAWDFLYNIIALSNTFLEKVSDDQDNLSQRARGEAFFLRGFAYYTLAQWYGRAIIFTTNPTTTEGFFKARASKEDTWNQAMDDLQAAAERLPAQYDASNVGRATKGAALAYMAKAQLYQQKWDQAVYYAEQAMGLGVYDLALDYSENFNFEGENNRESVLEVQFGPTTLVRSLIGGEAHHQLQNFGPKGLAGKIGFTSNVQGGYEPTQDLFRQYAPNDRRIKANFILPGDTITFDGKSIITPTNLVAFKKDWSSTGIANRKWVVAPSTFVDGNAWKSTLNWKLMRYAELLLLHAEAANELGDGSKALASLNRVRSRAGIKAMDLAAPAVLRDSIRLEYRRELEFEGHRFFHLVRWGTIPKVMIDRGFIPGKHELYPIDQDEIDRNPALDQNPGW